MGDAHPSKHRDIFFGSVVRGIGTDEQTTLFKIGTPTTACFDLQLLGLSCAQGQFAQGTRQGALFSGAAVRRAVDKKIPS